LYQAKCHHAIAVANQLGFKGEDLLRHFFHNDLTMTAWGIFFLRVLLGFRLQQILWGLSMNHNLVIIITWYANHPLISQEVVPKKRAPKAAAPSEVAVSAQQEVAAPGAGAGGSHSEALAAPGAGASGSHQEAPAPPAESESAAHQELVRKKRARKAVSPTESVNDEYQVSTL